MLNDYFYNENISSSSEKDFSEMEFLNPITTEEGHQIFKKDENKDFSFATLNKVKTDFFRKNLKKIQTNIHPEDEIENKTIQEKKFELKENETKNDYLFFNNKALKSLDKSKNLFLTSNDFNFTYKDIFSNKYKYICSTPSPILDNNNYTNDKFLFPIKSYVTTKINNENSDENKISIINKSINSNISNKISTQNNSQLNSVLYKRGPYKKKIKQTTDDINIYDKCFPFKTGKGIINLTTKFNYDPFEIYDNTIDLADEKTDKTNEMLLLNNKNNSNKTSENELYLMKFTTKKYYISETGRKKRIQKKRKYRADIIRKKIKSRFLKALKYVVNRNLKKSGSKLLFDCLPQCFVGNMNKILNNKCLDMTYKEIILYDFSNKLSNYRHTSKDNDKFSKNLKVLEYLEKNPDICQRSGFDIIQNLKYKNLLSNYFLSVEFEESLDRIKKENETEEYLQSYIYKAKYYIDFFTNIKPSDCKENNNNDIDANSLDDDEEDYEDD